jgi:hypothetical protein
MPRVIVVTEGLGALEEVAGVIQRASVVYRRAWVAVVEALWEFVMSLCYCVAVCAGA